MVILDIKKLKYFIRTLLANEPSSQFIGIVGGESIKRILIILREEIDLFDLRLVLLDERINVAEEDTNTYQIQRFLGLDPSQEKVLSIDNFLARYDISNILVSFVSLAADGHILGINENVNMDCQVITTHFGGFHRRTLTTEALSFMRNSILIIKDQERENILSSKLFRQQLIDSCNFKYKVFLNEESSLQS